MKKILVRLSIGLIVLAILVILGLSLFLDGTVKRAIETIGPRLAKVDVKLDGVSLSLLSGSGKIKGLVVGNPEPFKTPQAIHIGSASLELQPRSLLSEKIIIRSFWLESPEITFEGGFGGNNLSKLLANIKSSEAAETNATTPSGEKAGRKFQVDDLSITGAKVNVSLTGMGGKSIPVAIPTIHLTGLGKGPEGITAAELAKIVLAEIEKAALQAANQGVAEFSRGVKGITQDLGKNSTGAVDRVKKGLGDLFKK